MIACWKALAGASLLACAPALISANTPGQSPAVRPEVVQVICEHTRGSAFYAGPNIIISVAHVTTAKECTINGRPIAVLRQEGDFTILGGEHRNRWLRVDCRGYKAGHSYVGWGYARGLPSLTSVDLRGTGEMLWGLSRLWAVFTVIPGQSGGAIIDPDTDAVVGTINTYNPGRGDSGSVELRATSVCKGKANA